jgi:hypothetical protein
MIGFNGIGRSGFSGIRFGGIGSYGRSEFIHVGPLGGQGSIFSFILDCT